MKNTIIFLLMLPFFSHGQISLNGIVKDKNGAVEFANVVLTNSAAEYIKGAITNEDGSFEMNVAKGTYQVSVSHINYKTFEKAITLEDDLRLDPILLIENSNTMGEVLVTATKSIIRREIDKTIVNIENSPIAQTSNLFDALKSAPGLVISNDEIVMLGKSSVRIAMDGRMLQLSGDDLSNFLKSLSASDVKEIEIITNPSAKYEAEGNSGIVNIITKRINKNAWSNHFSITHNQAKYGWQAFNNNFSYQKNKLSLLFTAAYNTGKRNIIQIVEPNYSLHPQRIDSEQKTQLNSISPRVILDYHINKTTTIGLQYLGSFSKPTQLDDLKTTIFNSDFQVNSYLIADDTEYDRNTYNSSYNLYFDKKLDTLGKSLTLNFDLLDYQGSSRNDVLSKAFDPDLNFLNIEFANLGEADYQIKNFSIKADIAHPLKWINLSYGAKSTFSNTQYKLHNYNTLSGEPVFNPLQSNEFEFQENIQSAYINTSKKVNEQWEFQLGLRAEYTQTEGVSKETDLDAPTFKNHYGQLFPTFYAKYTKGKDHVFSLNYGKRINRPAYSQLNPARTFLSGQSSQLGNPFLSPSFSDNIEFTHTYQYNLSTTLSFNHASDVYSFIFELNDEAQEQVITYKNLFKEDRFSIMTSYQLNPISWWSARTLLFYGYSNSQKLNTPDKITLTNGSRLYVSVNNQLTINKAKTIIGEVDFWYDSPYSANLFSFGQAYSLDVAISFKSLIKGLSLTLGGYDLFNSSPRTITSMSNGVAHYYIAFPSNRYFSMTLAYNFGNDKISTKARNFGNEEVRRRSN